MNLHQIPLEIRRVTAVKTTEPVVERGTVNGDKLLYHRISNFTKEVRQGLHMMHPRTRRGWIADVPMHPCCDNEEKQWIMGKSLRETLGEKADAAGCKCECQYG
jgi:hypothetical protein